MNNSNGGEKGNEKSLISYSKGIKIPVAQS